jgi:hypothetical protein
MTYEIIDNFLPEDEFKAIQTVFLGDQFPWFYNNNTTFNDEGVEEPLFYFTHLLFGNFMANSDAYKLVQPVVDRLGARALVRAKANLYPSSPTPVQDGWHTDLLFPNKAAILYLNTNNGPTVLSDGTEIAAVANRLLKFNGDELHCSTRCSDEKIRVNINFNYL